MKKNHAVLAAIFIASLSSLAYQVILIRIFSVSLWYHFAFMVISISMLGLAAGGTVLSVYPRLRDMKYVPLYLIMLSISIPASYLVMNNIPLEPARLSWDRIQIFYITLYYLILSVPFFCFGLTVSTAFSEMRGYSRHIYAADLSGAGIGSILALLLLSTGGAEKIILVLASLSTTALFFLGNRNARLTGCVLLAVSLAGLYFQPLFLGQRISSYKPLRTALRFPAAELLHTYHGPFSRIDVFKSPAVRFAPGLSFRYLEPLPEQTGISVDAGQIHAVTNDHDSAKLDFIQFLPASLPYEMSEKENVLILEPKGGLSVLTAEYYRSKNIFKVDSDPLLIHSIQQYSSGYSTDIYRTNTWTGIGRSWLASNKLKFDLIDISMLNPLPSGYFGFSEDYRYTVEAFREYISHLHTDGMLSVNLFIIPPPRMELRLINTIAEAFKQHGVQDVYKNSAAIRSWGTLTLIFKRSALSGEDIQRLKNFAEDKRFDLLYYPGITGEETNVYVKMPSSEYFEAFQRVMLNESRQEFINSYLFDIRPVHDENPFFHYYLKFSALREVYVLMGKKWQFFLEEGYLIPAMFLQVLFLSLLLAVLPVVRVKKTSHIRMGLPVLFSLAYFAFLGTGFMFIEISLLQKMILPLENASYAAAVVIASVLLSSGFGSIASQRFTILQDNKVLLSLSMIILFYSIALPKIIPELFPLTLPAKVIAVFIILMPAGILMGIPFPAGIAALGKKHPELIPWAWAINGCFSVLAPILAVMFAITAGFKVVMLAGVLMYLMAFFSMKLLKQL